MKNIQIDQKIVEDKAKEAALKGAIQAVEEYYTGYDSPYKKAIKEQLSKNNIERLELPEIIGLINDKLTKEIDQLANTAISKTFIPDLKKFFTKVPADLKLSEILQEIIQTYSITHDDIHSFEMGEHSKFDWINVRMTICDKIYELTLHTVYNQVGKYQLLSLPRSFDSSSKYTQKMSIYLEDDKRIEMPFTKDVLSDPITRYLARLVMCKTQITLDVDGFTEDMWEDECHC